MARTRNGAFASVYSHLQSCEGTQIWENMLKKIGTRRGVRPAGCKDRDQRHKMGIERGDGEGGMKS
jgi:hypothetical protein